ncbi:MAG: hypothetical protein J7L37_03110 [Thermococcus sp.]|nr:hypothetical protein [Thermococcus sp.]
MKIQTSKNPEFEKAEVYTEKLKMGDVDSFRKLPNGVYLVEDLGFAKIYLQKPGTRQKGEYDFSVWVEKIEKGDKWQPDYGEMFKLFYKLKQKDPNKSSILYEALKGIVLDDMEPKEFFNKVSSIRIDHQKLGNIPATYLITIFKWIAMQEEVNYPTSYGKFGKKMPLFGIALIHLGLLDDKEAYKLFVSSFKRKRGKR